MILRPKIALYEPDIPQNTAAIIRTCSCFDVMLEIIDINYPPEIAFVQLVGEYHDDIELTFHLYDFDDDQLEELTNYFLD